MESHGEPWRAVEPAGEVLYINNCLPSENQQPATEVDYSLCESWIQYTTLTYMRCLLYRMNVSRAVMLMRPLTHFCIAMKISYLGKEMQSRRMKAHHHHQGTDTPNHKCYKTTKTTLQFTTGKFYDRNNDKIKGVCIIVVNYMCLAHIHVWARRFSRMPTYTELTDGYVIFVLI